MLTCWSVYYVERSFAARRPAVQSAIAEWVCSYMCRFYSRKWKVLQSVSPNLVVWHVDIFKSISRSVLIQDFIPDFSSKLNVLD